MGSCGSTVSSQQQQIAQWINTISALLSVLGSGCTILFYFFQSCNRKTARGTQQFSRLIFNLAIADFGATLLILISNIIVEANKELYTLDICISFRAVMQLFWLSSFFSSTMIAVHLYRAVHQKREGKVLYISLYVLSWCLPAVLVGILLFTNQFGRVAKVYWCHINKPLFQWLFWYFPMILSVLVNSVLYLFIWRSFNQLHTRKHLESHIQRQLTLYLLAFIMCWIWNVIENIRSYFQPDCPAYWLWILQDFFSPLQGFLNFLVYSVSNRLIPIPCFQSTNTPSAQVYTPLKPAGINRQDNTATVSYE